jgi:hypothetical protein
MVRSLGTLKIDTIDISTTSTHPPCSQQLQEHRVQPISNHHLSLPNLCGVHGVTHLLCFGDEKGATGTRSSALMKRRHSLDAVKRVLLLRSTRFTFSQVVFVSVCAT